jgi:hypothetical protein
MNPIKPCLFSLLFCFGTAWGQTPADAHPDRQHEQAPDSGTLDRQIETQRILESLNDQVTETARAEPDQPYTILEGGIRLPGVSEARANDQ